MARLAHLNVRSIVPHFNEFKDLVKEKFDIIGVTETWLSQNITNNVIAMNGYTLVRRDRTTAGGGVGVYIKNHIKAKIIPELSINIVNTEQLWLKVELSKRTFALGIVYRPPSQSVVDFLEQFENCINYIAPKFDELICMGDFNINALEDNCSAYIRLRNVLESYGLIQLVNEPTRYAPNKASAIDLVICSDNIIVNYISVEDASTVADHCLVSIEIQIGKQESKPHFITFRDYNKFIKDDFLNDLENSNLDQIFSIDNIDDKVNCFNTILLSTFNKHAPLRTVKITRPKAPWITWTIRQMMKIRDRALTRFKKTRNAQHFNYYKVLRNQTKYAINREKKAYLSFKIRNCRDKKTFWKELRNMNIYTKSKNKDLPLELKRPEEINNYFARAADTNLQVDNSTIQYFSKNTLPGVGQFSFSTINEIEISKSLLSIKSQAIGVDSLSVTMMVYAFSIISKYLCHIYNFCIENSVFPKVWKKSIVHPLPKIDNPVEFNSLRPISVLCVPAKVFEKILNYKITNHLEKFSIISPKQSGFRAKYSCTTALLTITDDILRAIDRKELVFLVLLDFTKAFDRIKHNLLLAILQYIGFSRSAILLLTNYFQGRQQAVLVDKISSNFIDIQNGVPQGSTLGPTLFIIYTFRLCQHLQFCTSHFYADDTQMYLSCRENELDEAQRRINSDLQTLYSTSNKYCLTVNPSKSKVLLFGNRRARTRVENTIRVNMNSEIIPLCGSAKNLGLIIDTTLRYTLHVNMIIKRAFCNLKLIYANRQLLDRNSKLVLCESMVLCHFNNNSQVFGHALKRNDMNRLQLVQNNCVRLICGVKRRDHITPYLKELGWLTMKQRFILHSSVLYHKIITTKCPSYLFEKIEFRTDVHHINIRYALRITPPLHTTALFQTSYSYMLAHLYNRIPDYLKTKSLLIFKKEMRKMIFQNEFNYM